MKIRGRRPVRFGKGERGEVSETNQKRFDLDKAEKGFRPET